MAEFLTTKGIAHYIEKIIRDADKELVLVSPYLQISTLFMERIAAAAARGVQVRILYGKNVLHNDELQAFSRIRNVMLYFYRDLHAKCYFNETHLILTSMNLYEYSEINNREMGVLMHALQDKAMFTDCVRETRDILALADTEKQGFCIRCGLTTAYDPCDPLCETCFIKWSKYQNGDYPEKFCHGCGRTQLTSVDRPQCYACFTEYQQNLF